MRTVALVPARLESTRLEKKLLRSISDLPLIVLTSKNLISSNLFDDVCVVTDSDEIIDVLKKHSINYLKSTKVYETGTDRIAEFANNFDCEIIINVQGDEPFINKDDLKLIINTFKEDLENKIDVISLKREISIWMIWIILIMLKLSVIMILMLFIFQERLFLIIGQNLI